MSPIKIRFTWKCCERSYERSSGKVRSLPTWGIHSSPECLPIAHLTRDLYFAYGKFHLCGLNCFISSFIPSFFFCLRKDNVMLAFLYPYSFPSITLKTDILSQTCQVFFLPSFRWLLKFYLTHKTFWFDQSVDMDFPAAQHWQQRPNFFLWSPETYIQ